MKGIRQYLYEMLYLLGDEKYKIPVFILLFSAASLLDLAGLGLIAPYTALALDLPMNLRMLDFLDQGPGQNRRNTMAFLGLVLLGIFLFKAMAGIMISRATIRFSQYQGERLGRFLMGKYQGMAYSDYLNRSSNEYIQSVSSFCPMYAGVLLTSLKMLGDLIVCTAILLLLAWRDISALSLLGVLLVISIFGYDRFFKKRLKCYGEEYNAGTLRVYQGVRESMEGFKEVRVLGKEAYFFDMVKEGMQKSYRYQGKMQLISTAPRFLLELVLIAFVVLLVLATLFSGRNLTQILPTLSMFGVAAVRLLPSMNILSQSLVNIRYYRDSISKLYGDYCMAQEFKAEVPVTGVVGDGVDFNFESLRVEGVSYAYPSAGSIALQNISLHIRKGESIGLMGQSGAGKTTLVDVLLGFLEPQGGGIWFNGIPMRDSLASWRKEVAYLPQNIFLIDDTLARNITMEEILIDQERLQESIRQARLEELLGQLPEGINTMLGERGIRLSGGQRQRIAIARAFYHGREVLIMDEATSALDNDTESEIVEEIRRLKGLKTVIVIAHRLTTLQHCDRIYELKNGKIIRSASYPELMGGGGLV